MKVSYLIKVTGENEHGRQTAAYILTAANTFDAIREALNLASKEYNSQYDADGKPIPGTEYKEFRTVTSVELVV